jgi:hypothetical protein
MACDRFTVGNPSKKSSMDSPPFQSVDEILQRNPRAGKNGRAAHNFRVGVNDAPQIFIFHNTTTLPLLLKLSPANKNAGCSSGPPRATGKGIAEFLAHVPDAAPPEVDRGPEG